MSARSRRRLLLFVPAAVAAAAWLWSAGPGAERVVLPAVEAEAFGGAPEPWERLKAMGVAAVVLREASAAELVARGSVMYFSRGEVEKWRALGLVAAGGGPPPGSLWTKDAKALARLSSALAARGVDVSTASVAGYEAFALPPGIDLARVPVGFEPETVSALSAAGLIAVEASTGSSVLVAGRRLWIRTLPAAAREPELLRAIYSRPSRLLILRPDPGLGLEENLELLRAALKVVKRAGLPAVLPAVGGGNAARPKSFPSEIRWKAVLALFYAIGLLGPLLAARVGLLVERRVRSWTASRAPISAPVPETLAGLAAVWAAASAAGLLAAALPQAAAREAATQSWTLWTLSAPLAVAAAALFASEGPSWGARWRAPLSARDLAAAGALALALACLLAPRAFLRAAGIWESADWSPPAAAYLPWWWPWRWREILVGAPSLVLALILAGRSAKGARTPPGEGTRSLHPLDDPRGWLALGLLAPAGTVAAVGAGNVPAGLAVAQGAAAFALGAALGFALAVFRTRIKSWVQRPVDPGLLT